MSGDEPRRTVSANCRENAARPNKTHVCTGCECRCHVVAAPPDFRDRVAREREGGDDADPVAGP